MKNYAHLIERKLLEAICEKLEIDHAAIVEPIRAEWKEAVTQHNAEIDQRKAEREKQLAERTAAYEKKRAEREAANKEEQAEFAKRQAERKARIEKLFAVPEVKLCSEEERPRLEAKLRNLHAEQEAAYDAYFNEEDPVSYTHLTLPTKA